MPESAPRRSYDSGRRQQAARRNRAAMLAACRELLFREGYQATTIRAVATRAGVSPETVYKAFGGKPGLVKALWDVTLAGDDEPLAMADRPQLRAVWQTRDAHTKLRLYAAFVRGVHERLAALFTLLAQAGSDVGQVLDLSEEERMLGVTAFVTHLTETGALPADADTARLADSCWVLTGPHLFIQLTDSRGWRTGTYENWLAGMLASALLGTTWGHGSTTRWGVPRAPQA
ncbi:TetR/AcrR family transcriptional regulator [Streptomyces sp. So13.3]|uniref:TetR/AcrR family transcriptional regulator n=1 Tax=Streptomyces TaxID=1883 RepID=UPI0011060574|nr:TetR/AcrR family transcriptional regulator [Streptomyces sp. So13.3]QNA76309.1 TetR/AcrR family transcriptional regulator [Streptomyces sp. So13.3]